MMTTRAIDNVEHCRSMEDVRRNIDALDDMKAQDITVLNTESLTDEFDRVIIASATSNRQTRGAANNVHEKVKENGGDVLSTEGEDTGEWVLVDLGDIIVHVMLPRTREFYGLERLWTVGDDEIPAALAG